MSIFAAEPFMMASAIIKGVAYTYMYPYNEQQQNLGYVEFTKVFWRLILNANRNSMHPITQKVIDRTGHKKKV